MPGGEIFRRRTTYHVSHIGGGGKHLYRHETAFDPDPGVDLNLAVCD